MQVFHLSLTDLLQGSVKGMGQMLFFHSLKHLEEAEFCVLSFLKVDRSYCSAMSVQSSFVMHLCPLCFQGGQ